MTVAESSRALVPDAQGPEPAQPRRPDVLSVLDTTELRWFVPGPIPADIRSWFTGSTGVPEQRCDTYLLDGRGDIGVKRRSRETLELKVRQSLDGRIELGEGLAGSLEAWRKWSPAEGLVEDGADGRWVDVHKSVVKRRFSIDGTEIAFSSDSQVTGAGCDVEVAAVTVGAVEGWTFAFAAFGPPTTRQDALLASWQGLVAATPCPEPFGPRTGRAVGYPKWLALTISPDPAQPVDATSRGTISLTSTSARATSLAPVFRSRRRHQPPSAGERASPADRHVDDECAQERRPSLGVNQPRQFQNEVHEIEMGRT